MKPIRVLIVDDSAFVRTFIRQALQRDPNIEVVGVARDGEDAIEKARQLQPDVVTLDVEMPRKSGLEALPEILRVSNAAVIMVSSLTREGARETLQALEKGAADFIPKPDSLVGSGAAEDFRQALLQKVRLVGAHRERFRRILRPEPKISSHGAVLQNRRSTRSVIGQRPRKLSARQYQLVIIGVSTGGPLSLQRVIPALPADFPIPVIVVQHMPPQFTQSLAERLSMLSPLHVKEAAEGERLQSGVVYVAPGGQQMLLRSMDRSVVVRIVDRLNHELFRPSVNITTFSALEIFGGNIIGVMMTGMGSDGKEAFVELHRRGGAVIAQDEQSCVVYGMPRAVVEAGVADYVVPLDDIPQVLVKLVVESVTSNSHRS